MSTLVMCLLLYNCCKEKLKKVQDIGQWFLYSGEGEEAKKKAWKEERFCFPMVQEGKWSGLLEQELDLVVGSDERLLFIEFSKSFQGSVEWQEYANDFLNAICCVGICSSCNE